MTLGEKIKNARKSAGMTQKELSELLLTVRPTAVSNWEKDINKPDIDTLSALCMIFGKPVSYFFELPPDISEKNLDDDELDIIKKYRSLDDESRKFIKSAVDHEYSRNNILIKAGIHNNTIKIRLADLSASAGTGDYLDNSSFEFINIRRTQEAETADFAVRVNGDSMEPKYCSNDIVLVKKTPEIETGETGIFILNGCGYIKMLGRSRLISFNKKYNDIIFHDYDNIYCCGRVIGTAEVV